jgi:GT2 family glycosyltransferase
VGWAIVFTPAAEIVHHLGRSMARTPLRSRFEYDRSHLRYYRKHNGTLEIALLRARLAAGAVRGWVAAMARGGSQSSAERRHHRDVLLLALRGEP